MVIKIAEFTEYDKNKIEPVKNSFFKSISLRPKNTSFDILKLINILNYKLLNIIDGINYLKLN